MKVILLDSSQMDKLFRESLPFSFKSLCPSFPKTVLFRFAYVNVIVKYKLFKLLCTINYCGIFLWNYFLGIGGKNYSDHYSQILNKSICVLVLRNYVAFVEILTRCVETGSLTNKMCALICVPYSNFRKLEVGQSVVWSSSSHWYEKYGLRTKTPDTSFSLHC